MKKDELVILAKLIRKIVNDEIRESEQRILTSVRKTISEQYTAVKDVEDIGLSRAATVFNQKTTSKPKSNISKRVHPGKIETHAPIFSKDPVINEMLNSVTKDDLLELEGDNDFAEEISETNSPELKAVSDAINRDYSSLMKAMNQRYGK